MRYKKIFLTVLPDTALLPLQGNAGDLLPRKGSTPEAERRSSSLSASKMEYVPETL